MKKTKLLTSLAALALVLSVGACTEVTEETTTEDSSEEETTTESTTEGNTSEDTTEDNTSEDETSGNTSSETTPATTIEQLTAVFTLYDDSGAAQSCPSYGGLYFRGTFNGEDNGYWLEDGPFTLLEETTNSKGEVAYTYTFKDVLISDEHEFVVVFTYDGDTPGSPYQLVTKETTKVDLTGDIESGSTIEFDCTNCHNIAETYPEKIVDSSNPVADLLADVKENNNYSLTIEYYDWTSPTYDSESGMYQDFENDTISKNSERHYIVDLTCTEDVFCLEYYYGYNDWLSGRTYDIEIYVNNGTNLDVYFINNEYDTTIYKYTTYTGYSWQTYWTSNSLLGLNSYLDHFVVDPTSYDGSKVDYSITIDTVDFLGVLIDALYHCGNYYAEGNYASNITPFINNYKTYWNTLGEPYQNCTYSFDKEEWDTTLYYLEENVTKVNETTNEYQLKYHGVSAYVSEVGTSVIADLYTAQFS